MIKSVWNDTVSLPTFPQLKGDTKTDVLIIGGGLAGLLCAYELQQAGVDYLLIEADRICGGISGNTTAKLTSQHGLIYSKLLRQYGAEQAKLYWEAQEQALDRYRSLAQSIPCDLEEKDAFVYSTDRPEAIEAELNALEQLEIPAYYEKDLPLPIPTVGAVCFPHQAQFHPLKFAAGLAAGLNIREGTRAQAFAGRRVQTNYGTITAERIVVCTHFPLINKHGAFFLKQYQHRSYVLALENAPELGGIYLDENDKGLSFRNYHGLLFFGGASHRTGKQGGGWTELSALAKQCYPSAREKYRWAAQDCMTLDGLPYIGRYSLGSRGLYVATGFNKWGMTSSMVSALLLRDLLLDRNNPYVSLFSPSRSILHPQLALNAVESTLNLLTPTAPRCPHMGCALKWNAQEHSWDCPCHGSRFSQRGALLDNPSNGDLKKL
ncbi:MAG: FAD-dependent oxidoreductase [Oscillospiraceae bacterium]|nr:FAD-dependent oxidoreductase [Oscillospiraceae bacterium]